MTNINTTCRLCERPKKLELSHLIPKFITKWLKNSGTGKFRSLQKINKTVEDSIRIPLLCRECENTFGKYERYFSGKIFNSVVTHNLQTLKYDENLSKFVLSVLWRLLEFGDIYDKGINSETRLQIESIKNKWKSVFLMNQPIQKDLEIHMLCGMDILRYENSDAQTGFEIYYFGRVVDSGAVAEGEFCFLYLKIPRFLFLIPIKGIDTSKYTNTLIDNEQGEHHILKSKIEDHKLGLYFRNRILHIEEMLENKMSTAQKEANRKKSFENWDSIKTKDLGIVLEYQKNKNGST